MAELWPMMEFNPIKFNNPNGPQKIEILKRLDPLHVKSHQKVSPQNGRVMACNVIAQSIEK